MADLDAAARLLSRAVSHEALHPIAAFAGCGGKAASLDLKAREALGLAEFSERASISAGAGALRALMLDLRGSGKLRDDLRQIAARVSARAPHSLWLLLARESEGELAIATWSAESARPRVAALMLTPGRVLPADAETLCALASVDPGEDVLIQARWMDILGRDAITRGFYRNLELTVRQMAGSLGTRVNTTDARALALLDVSRLLFLSFLESRGWLDSDHRFLSNGFERCMSRGGSYRRNVLAPLFFGTLNTPSRKRSPAARALGAIPFLNGGLFARTPLERRHKLVIGDDQYGELYDRVLLRYRFTPRESAESFSEAAIDPEMLGKAFESLMAADSRRTSGAFYTPQPLVARVTEYALQACSNDNKPLLSALERALRREPLEPIDARRVRDRLVTLRVLDPACGSGAFLVHALQEISDLLEHAGDRRPASDRMRAVLGHSIFGVDADPTAVWLCELRLWLAVSIQDPATSPAGVRPLPNLDRHVRVGDSLRGELDTRMVNSRSVPANVSRLRERYASATGARKYSLGRALERAERSAALARLESELAIKRELRRESVLSLRGRDLFGNRARADSAVAASLGELRAEIRALQREKRRIADGGALPFTWHSHVPDVLAEGGFDVVLGNPPWVRLHNIPAARREELRATYDVFARAAWMPGAERARAGKGFAAQVDAAAIFTERSLSLVRPSGVIALLLPVKLWRSLAGGGVRRLLRERGELIAIEDWSLSPALFDASVYPSVLVARAGSKGQPKLPPRVSVSVRRREAIVRWDESIRRLGLEPDDTASPWVLLPPPARRAFERLRRSGPALAESPLGPPLLGVKTGCNQAFVVTMLAREGELARIASGDRTGMVESALLRPLLRGEGLNSPGDSQAIVWPYDERGRALATLPPAAARWLGGFRRALSRRSDLRPGMAWWSLFRTASANPAVARVVWADVGRTLRPVVLAPGDDSVPINSCYVLPCASELDANAVAALLSSSVCGAWLHAIAEPARGGYHRHLAWTMALLPLPGDWKRAREMLSHAWLTGEAPRTGVLAAAYKLAPASLSPLVEWDVP